MEKVNCICRQCDAVFQIAASAAARGRGRYCGRKCAAIAGGAKRTADPMTPAERYERHVIRRGPDECWGWNGFKHKGYGRLKGEGSAAVGAHRISYEKYNGPVPAGLTVLHRCDNPECTNPRHLTVGTNLDNNRDRDSKGRTATGAQNGRSKYTASMVREMRAMRATGRSVVEIAKLFDVSAEGASSAIRGRTWKHLS